MCPCGNSQKYAKCCGQYLSGRAYPTTAEALMRSRYSAYSQGDIAYIEATMRGRAAEGYDAVAAKQWATTAVWKGLTVVRAFPHPVDPTRAYVEFVAKFSLDGVLEEITEVSEFCFEDGRWYYTDRVTEPVVLEILLAGSPKAKLLRTQEDHQWLNSKPVGKEII